MKNELIHLSLCLELWEAPSDRTSDERGGGGGGVGWVGEYGSAEVWARMFAFVSGVCDIKGLT